MKHLWRRLRSGLGFWCLRRSARFAMGWDLSGTEDAFLVDVAAVGRCVLAGPVSPKEGLRVLERVYWRRRVEATAKEPNPILDDLPWKAVEEGEQPAPPA